MMHDLGFVLDGMYVAEIARMDTTGRMIAQSLLSASPLSQASVPTEFGGESLQNFVVRVARPSELGSSLEIPVLARDFPEMVTRTPERFGVSRDEGASVANKYDTYFWDDPSLRDAYLKFRWKLDEVAAKAPQENPRVSEALGLFLHSWRDVALLGSMAAVEHMGFRIREAESYYHDIPERNPSFFTKEGRRARRTRDARIHNAHEALMGAIAALEPRVIALGDNYRRIKERGMYAAPRNVLIPPRQPYARV